MSDTYKLIYFNIRGRAEQIRLLFKLAGKEFQDVRVSQKEDWPELKNTMPLGQLPVLEVNGVALAQTRTIARFVAKELKLSGSNNLEEAICDMFCETCAEVEIAIVPAIFGPFDEKDAAVEKTIKLLESVNKLVKGQKKGKFILGDKPSLADTQLYSVVEFMQKVTEVKVPDDIAEIAKNFRELPNITTWIKERPESEF